MKGTRTGSSRELDGDRFAEVVLEFWRTILGAWMSNIAWKQFSGSRKVQRIQFVSRERKKKKRRSLCHTISARQDGAN